MDTNDLAARLIGAAKDAVGANCVAEWDAPDGLVVEIYEVDAAKGVAAAVLRELAAYMGPRFNTIGVADVRHLANEIEPS